MPSSATAACRRAAIRFAILVAAAPLSACGGSVEEPLEVPSLTGPSVEQAYRWPLSATVTLTPDGPRPTSVTINVGGRVTFVNRDTRAHEIVSDPYLRHEDCPSINRVGFLAPGEQRESAIFEAVRMCGFHDHLDPTRLIGLIEVRIE